jgi:murein DD-endopeptidase MepM/ murein hydrolase activator NlpD
MKKFYYFSEKSLNFLEIKHFKEKALTVFIISVLLFSSILFGIFYFVSNLYTKDDYLQSLKKENELLKDKFSLLTERYGHLESELKSITDFSNELRLAVNLTPVSIEERKLGIGGSNAISKLYSELGSDITAAIDLADNVLRKFEFEKMQYEEIASKLKTNNNLFESIPAIVPTDGKYSSESFGMRLHPILKINKMHNGIDIVNQFGSPVKATGKGKVVFAGAKGGYGLTVEIDHGFGYQTVYAHLSKINVREGQIVNRNQMIGKSGNSGLSSGPHLHYEVLHNGQNLNPAEFFFDEYSYFESNHSN